MPGLSEKNSGKNSEQNNRSGTRPAREAPRRPRRNAGSVHRRIVASATLATLFAAPACTTFRPLGGDPAAGEQVRAHLTPEGQVRQASATGMVRTSVEGSVLAVEADALLLVVPIPGVVPELQRSPKVADTLRIARADVTGVDVQEFSAARSGLLAGGVVAVGVLGVLLAGHVGSSDGLIDDPTNRNALRPSFPMARIPIGR